MNRGARWILLLIAMALSALVLALALPHTPAPTQQGDAAINSAAAIKISLAGQPQPEPPEKVSEQAQPAPQPEPKPEPEPQPEPDPKPEPEPTPEPEPEPEPIPEPEPEPEPIPEPEPVAEPTPQPEPVTPVTEAATDTSLPDAPVADAPSNQQQMEQVELHAGASSDVDSYLTRLNQHLNRHYEYPRRARRLRQEGTPVVVFEFNRQGELVSHELLNSSSYTLLDRAALELLEEANPLPPVPDTMAGNTFTFTLPIRFNIR